MVPKKSMNMSRDDVVVAVFARPEDADTAIRQLATAGFGQADVSVVGKSAQPDEQVISFFNVGSRVSFSGPRGRLWSGLWGLFEGGLLTTVPVVGPVVVVGYLAPTVHSRVERAASGSGLGIVAAGIHVLGIPRHSAMQYEAALGADAVVVMVRGDAPHVGRASALLGAANPSRLDMYEGVRALTGLERPVGA